MKYNIDDLYFARCRHCIMDIVNVVDENGNIMSPHPDYFDYYTILLYRNDTFINIFDRNIKYRIIASVENDQEHYDEDLIMEMCLFADYHKTDNKRISKSECEQFDDAIQKTLKIKYGYKNKTRKI